MRRPLLTAVLIAAGAVAVIVIAGAVVVATADLNALMGPVADRVKAATGRDLKVGGGVGVKLSLRPEIELRDVTLSNAPWAGGPSLVTAKRLTAQVALLPLFSRRFEILRITLSEPSIALETDMNGRGNWEFALQPRERPPPAAGDSSKGDGFAFGVGDLELDDGMLSYRNGRTGAVTRVVIEHFALQARDAQAPVNATFRGAVDGIAVALTGHAGPLSTLLERSAPYPLALDGEIAGRKASVSTKLSAKDQGAVLGDLQLALGESRVAGTMTLATLGGRRRLTLALTSPRLTLADWAFPAAAASAVAATPAAGAVRTPASRHLFADTPLPLAALRDMDATGEIAIDELVWGPGKRAERVHLSFALEGGRLTVPAIAAGLFGGSVAGSMVVEAAAKPPRITMRLTGRDLDLGRILASSGVPREVRGGRTAAEVDLSARGDSAHGWASSATGRASLVVGPATVVNAKPEAGSTVSQVTAAVNPWHGAERATELKCAVVRLPLADGVARFDRSVAVETDKLGVALTGTIDFRDETLDVALHPSVRQGIPIDIAQVASLVRLRGPWHDPRMSVDATTSAATVARLGAVVATGGLSALGGLLVLGALTQDGPCVVAMGTPARRGEDYAGKTAPGNVVEDLRKGLGRLLQR
ncbi:MAG: AsmA family protein [Betaproteobacteria bacterium]